MNPNKKQLGRLERVSLREVWNGEATDFTPWLAENLDLIADTVGIELELEAQERNVGPFRADLLCKDIASDSWVLIENQLEKTDHTHLGQLMTYAAGLDAVTIIWVAERFTDEHRAALDWLNRITNEKFLFFGLEVEVWRIGQSAQAPKLNVVCKPNNWAKSIRPENALSDTEQLQFEYWSAFREFMLEHFPNIKAPQAQPGHWIDFSIGRTGFNLTARVNTRDKNIAVGLFITHQNAKDFFNLLNQQRIAIETECGTALDWQRNDNKKRSQILLFKTSTYLEKREDWRLQFAWFLKTIEMFRQVFGQRIKNLDLPLED